MASCLQFICLTLVSDARHTGRARRSLRGLGISSEASAAVRSNSRPPLDPASNSLGRPLIRKRPVALRCLSPLWHRMAVPPEASRQGLRLVRGTCLLSRQVPRASPVDANVGVRFSQGACPLPVSSSGLGDTGIRTVNGDVDSTCVVELVGHGARKVRTRDNFFLTGGRRVGRQ